MAEFETIVGEDRPAANLIVENGEMVGTTTPISKHQVVLGRDKSIADVVVKDRLASRRHARISWMAFEYVIEDLNSSNGSNRVIESALGEAHCFSK